MFKTPLIIALVLMVFSTNIQSQSLPGWEEIDKRPTPQWWLDAKFGIFIHWGLYAVPSFSKTGEYAEWYWHDLLTESRPGHAMINEFHRKNYGENFTYPDFARQFKTELFDAEQWASVFRNSGAKYVVLTSKHHDGFCLWPSAEADRSWGRPWNSVSTGPQRNLLKELTDAVRGAGLKMGYYYSLYEWFNPLYQTDVDLFVEKHMIPQFKDLVNNYSPEVIFADGEWNYPHTTWRATELLTWLINESPAKDDVVINDRWGKHTRHKHGGYFTTEYGSGLSTAENPWEENRGMGHSYGFNRMETAAHYNSSQEFVYMLIDIVSRGGNLLLNIGPAGDGRIPVIMQQKLADIGDWLAVNGEAIYGTRPWKQTCQWSDGEINEPERGSYKSKYDIMELTIDPPPGKATKEIFFTTKENILYAICPIFPEKKLIIKDLTLPTSAKVSFLGMGGNLQWQQAGNSIEVMMPAVNPSKMPCDYAYTFKIEKK